MDPKINYEFRFRLQLHWLFCSKDILRGCQTVSSLGGFNSEYFFFERFFKTVICWGGPSLEGQQESLLLQAQLESNEDSAIQVNYNRQGPVNKEMQYHCYLWINERRFFVSWLFFGSGRTENVNVFSAKRIIKNCKYRYQYGFFCSASDPYRFFIRIRVQSIFRDC